MQKTEKFFIFSWKEITVIILLFVITVGFFFTLGLHYGKNLHLIPPPPEVSGKLEESPEVVPPKDVIEKASQNAALATEDAIKTSTEEEVKKSGVKVDIAKPVDLPSQKVKPVEKPIEASHEVAAKENEEEASAPVEKKSENHFAVQLGSYQSKPEAQQKIKVLVSRGLKPEVRTAVVNGQTRFRVVLLGFKTKQIADQKGKELRSKRKIENFVVIKAD